MPVIGLFGTIIINSLDLYAVYTYWDSFQGLKTYGIDTSPLIICVIIDLILVGLAINGLRCIFTRCPGTRSAMLWYYGISITITFAYLYTFGTFEASINAVAGETISNSASEDMRRFGSSIVWTIIWMIYWVQSKRVEHTFSNKTLV